MDTTVKVQVHIRKNETGEIRIHEDELYLDHGQPNFFIWEDGNYSCDCNRRLFFARAKDEEEDLDSGCSTGEYSVEIKADGKVIYSDYCKHMVTQGREGETGSWCVKCGVKVLEVEERVCDDCAFFMRPSIPRLGITTLPPYCKKQMMTIISGMHVTYHVSEGTCFEPKS